MAFKKPVQPPAAAAPQPPAAPSPSLFAPPGAVETPLPPPVQQQRSVLSTAPEDWPRNERGEPKQYEEMNDGEVRYCLDTYGTVQVSAAIGNDSIGRRVDNINTGKNSYPPWQAGDAAVYDRIMTEFGGSDRCRITSLRRVLPDSEYLVAPSGAEVPTFSHLVQWIRNKCWNGQKSRFQYTVTLGGKQLCTGAVDLGDDPVRQHEYRTMVASLGRSAVTPPGLPGGALLADPLQPTNLFAPPAAPPVATTTDLARARAEWEREKENERLRDQVAELQGMLRQPPTPAAPLAAIEATLGRIVDRLERLERGEPASPRLQGAAPPPPGDNFPPPPEGHELIWDFEQGRYRYKRMAVSVPQLALAAPPVVRPVPEQPPPPGDNWPPPPEGFALVWDFGQKRYGYQRIGAEPVAAAAAPTSTALVPAAPPKPQGIVEMAEQVVAQAEQNKRAVNLVAGALGFDPLFAPPSAPAATSGALAASPAEEKKEEEKKTPPLFHDEGGVKVRRDPKGNPITSLDEMGPLDLLANGEAIGGGITWLTNFWKQKEEDSVALSAKKAEVAIKEEQARQEALKSQLLQQELQAKTAETVLRQRQAVAALQGPSGEGQVAPAGQETVSSGQPPSS